MSFHVFALLLGEFIERSFFPRGATILASLDLVPSAKSEDSIENRFVVGNTVIQLNEL